jgi:hypothetical protein
VPLTLKHRLQVHCANQAELPPLHIAVVYDGFADLIRVHDIWSRLISPLRDEMRIFCRAWNFAVLRDRRLRERAALHTAKADLIVLSANGRSEPPDYIKLWINAWLPRKKGRRNALVAVLDGNTSEGAAVLPLRTYLRHTAKRSRIDFFCDADQRQSLTKTQAGFCLERNLGHERGTIIFEANQLPGCH